MGEVTTSAFAGGKAGTASRPAGRGDQLGDGLTDPLVRARTPIQAPAVQADGGAVAGTNPQGVAASGISGGGGPLPHHDRIQSSFGRHDVSGVTAHTDSSAVAANSALGSHGFAVGNHVALATNDLHTAAHEAAHTVQQSEGVHLVDGVGKSGDAYEQHADKVADAVVEGRSAEALLDSTPSGTGGPGIQFDKDEADLPAELKGPDRVNAADTEVYTVANGSNVLDRIGPTKGIRVGALTTTVRRGGLAPLQRYEVKWHKWSTPNKGFVEVKGYVDSDRIAGGSTAQTSVSPVKILPNSAAGIKQEDVYQQGLSDCYFQAAMAAVASSSPGTIFNTMEIEEGSVVVTFWLTARNEASESNEDLVQQRITVSNSLLLDAQGQPTYGGKLKEGSYAWPAFMSKAWAVVKGSYSDAAMGSVGVAIRAITGHADSGAITKGETGALAWPVYDKIRGALGGESPAVIGTENFAKEGWLAQKRNDKKKGLPRDQPQGNVRNLHSYAVIAMDKTDLTQAAFATDIPSVKLTLRDPRDAAGATFQRTLKDIISAGKFTQVHTG